MHATVDRNGGAMKNIQETRKAMKRRFYLVCASEFDWIERPLAALD